MSETNLADRQHVPAEEAYHHLTPRTALPEASDLDSHEAAVEVVILWGELSILHVAHVSPPRDIWVGDAVDAHGRPATDYVIGSESLGTERLPIVVMHDSRIALAIPRGAAGEVSFADESVSFEALAEQAQLLAAEGRADVHLYLLPLGATARFQHRGFTFIVKRTTAARRIGVGEGQGRTLKQHVWTIVSMMAHVSLLLLFQLLPPHSSALSVDLLNPDSRLVSYLDRPSETVNEDKPKWLQDEPDADGGSGKSQQGDDGQMGKQDQPNKKSKHAIKGPADNPDPHMARDEIKQSAATAGIVGLIKQNLGVWSSPTSMFGRDTASGRDLSDAVGALIADRIGGSFGYSDLGMRGHGRGGGGNGEGTIGVGNIGTIGRGNGTGKGDDFGKGAGGLHGRVAKVPRVRSETAEIHGSLAKEVIRRTIGRHISEVRFCYEQELNAHPDLQGRVTVKFIIAPTGAVQAAAVEKSELGNTKAEQCIAQAVRRWTFPSPEGGGLVLVSYPFLLSQVGN